MCLFSASQDKPLLLHSRMLFATSWGLKQPRRRGISLPQCPCLCGWGRPCPQARQHTATTRQGHWEHVSAGRSWSEERTPLGGSCHRCKISRRRISWDAGICDSFIIKNRNGLPTDRQVNWSITALHLWPYCLECQITSVNAGFFSSSQGVSSS